MGKVKLLGELFHPNTELNISSEIGVYSNKIATKELNDKGGNLNSIGVGNESVSLGAIIGDIEEMEGNTIKKFKLTGVSVIPKLGKK